MTQTITGLDGVIKRLWPQSAIEHMFYGKCPLFGRMKKTTDAEGSPIACAIQSASGGGGSADFTSAQSSVNAEAFEKFDLTVVDEYQLGRITTKAIRATKSNRGALVRALGNTLKTKMQMCKERMCHALYRDRYGVLGRQLSGAGTTTLTLYSGAEMRLFKVGDTIVSSANADGTSVSTNSAVITGINRAARTITAASNFHADFNDDDYLYVIGDAGAKLRGLAEWVPLVAPTSTAFYGVDRTADIETLGGRRKTATLADDANIAGAIINGGAELHDYAAMPDSAFLNPLDFAYLTRDVEDATVYRKTTAMGPDGKPRANIGYGHIEVETAAGTINVYADPYCPRGLAYVLQMDTWELFSYGPMPGFLDEDDLGRIVRVYNADSYEFRIGAYWVMGCHAPGYNMVIDISQVNGT